jgi:hypothetical protein
MRRVTFGGPELETFAWSGPVAHVKVIFPRSGDGRHSRALRGESTHDHADLHAKHLLETVRLRTNGLICIDNVLWSGRIVDPSDNDASTAALRALNAKIGKDERVDAIILPLGDGLNVVRKR